MSATGSLAECLLSPRSPLEPEVPQSAHKRPYRAGYPRPAGGPNRFGIGDDVLGVIGTLSDAVPALVPKITTEMAGRFYGEFSGAWGTHGEVFTGIFVKGKGTSTEIGVPLEFAASALEVILGAHRVAGPFAGFIAFRFVRRSDALLAFTRFPVTCTIEFPGVFSRHSERYFEQVWNSLDRAGIPYTFHWGQVNNLTPARVRAMYGVAVDQWIASRERLRDPRMREVFSSPFLEQCGLAT